MPIYEYGCYDCRRRVSVFWRSIAAADAGEACCPHCGGTNLKRLISRVARIRSEEQRLDALADPDNLGALDDEDPRQLGRWMREMGKEMGEDVDPTFDEVIDRLEAGQSFDEIESDLPTPADSTTATADDAWLP